MANASDTAGAIKNAPRMKRAIWITWERQRRNSSFANMIGAKYCEISVKGSRVLRYIISIAQTLKLICKERPTHIFYQNPSLILAVTVASLGRWLSPGAKIIGDYHNAGVFPPALGVLTQFSARHSDIVIVTNDSLMREVESWGAMAISIPDPLPTLLSQTRQRADDGFLVLFVCSWADDEPVLEVVKAAQQLLDSAPFVKVHITGRPKLEKLSSIPSLPSNVTLTGFLSHADFDQYLLDADVVMDLTTRPDCMVCGGYESTAAETPMILSNNPPTKAYFSKGAIFVDNTASSIASAISAAHAHHSTLNLEVRTLKLEMEARQFANLSKLSALIDPDTRTC